MRFLIYVALALVALALTATFVYGIATPSSREALAAMGVELVLVWPLALLVRLAVEYPGRD